MLSYPKHSCFRFAALTLRRGRWIGEAETEGLNFSVKMGLKGQFYDDNSFILFAVRPAKKGGREQGVQGGRPLFRYSCSDWARQRRA